jgi:hypothetical protein
MARPHGPEKEIIDPAQMRLIVVSGQPRRQQPVQGQGVDQQLQMVLWLSMQAARASGP